MKSMYFKNDEITKFRRIITNSYMGIITDSAHSKARKIETTYTAKPERLNKQDWTTRGASEITT